ncbi:hypothetical protein, partial [Corallococcus sp. 4LFB]|uniref:hypothetical protein n=1 Tax=Corallococcus sp. 4LFB TaxID=3383249 RepID=UPI003976C471
MRDAFRRGQHQLPGSGAEDLLQRLHRRALFHHALRVVLHGRRAHGDVAVAEELDEQRVLALALAVLQLAGGGLADLRVLALHRHAQEAHRERRVALLQLALVLVQLLLLRRPGELHRRRHAREAHERGLVLHALAREHVQRVRAVRAAQRGHQLRALRNLRGHRQARGERGHGGGGPRRARASCARRVTAGVVRAQEGAQHLHRPVVAPEREELRGAQPQVLVLAAHRAAQASVTRESLAPARRSITPTRRSACSLPSAASSGSRLPGGLSFSSSSKADLRTSGSGELSAAA